LEETSLPFRFQILDLAGGPSPAPSPQTDEEPRKEAIPNFLTPFLSNEVSQSTLLSFSFLPRV
jgi:hypothetical protein